MDATPSLSTTQPQLLIAHHPHSCFAVFIHPTDTPTQPRLSPSSSVYTPTVTYFSPYLPIFAYLCLCHTMAARHRQLLTAHHPRQSSNLWSSLLCFHPYQDANMSLSAAIIIYAPTVTDFSSFFRLCLPSLSIWPPQLSPKLPHQLIFTRFALINNAPTANLHIYMLALNSSTAPVVIKDSAPPPTITIMLLRKLLSTQQSSIVPRFRSYPTYA